jgi:hypothetical protein
METRLIGERSWASRAATPQPTRQLKPKSMQLSNDASSWLFSFVDMLVCFNARLEKGKSLMGGWINSSLPTECHCIYRLSFGQGL